MPKQTTSSLQFFVGGRPEGVAFTTGTFTCNGATNVNVADTKVTANSFIVVGLKTVGGTVGALPVVQTKTAGTGFAIKGTALDTSVYYYTIFEPVAAS